MLLDLDGLLSLWSKLSHSSHTYQLIHLGQLCKVKQLQRSLVYDTQMPHSFHTSIAFHEMFSWLERYSMVDNFVYISMWGIRHHQTQIQLCVLCSCACLCAIRVNSTFGRTLSSHRCSHHHNILRSLIFMAVINLWTFSSTWRCLGILLRHPSMLFQFTESHP